MLTLVGILDFIDMEIKHFQSESDNCVVFGMKENKEAAIGALREVRAYIERNSELKIKKLDMPKSASEMAFSKIPNCS